MENKNLQEVEMILSPGGDTGGGTDRPTTGGGTGGGQGGDGKS